MSERKPEKIGTTEAVKRFERRGIVVSDDTVRRMCERGQLPAERIGGRWFIDPNAVDKSKPE